MASGGAADACFVADAVNGIVGMRSWSADSMGRLERAAQRYRRSPGLGNEPALAILAAFVALGQMRPQDVRASLGGLVSLLGHPGEGVGPPQGIPPSLAAQVGWLVGVSDAWVGDLPRGIAALRRTIEIAPPEGEALVALVGMLLGKALALRGDIAEARRQLVTARELAAGSDATHLGNGHLECSVYLPIVEGDDVAFAAMLELLAAPGRGGWSGLAPEYRLELATVVALAGDQARATELVAGLLGPHFRGRPTPPLFQAWAAWVTSLDLRDAQRALAVLATTPSDPAYNLPAARVTWILGTHVGRQGDRAEAIWLLESAAERLTAMGALGYVRRIESELTGLALPRSPLGPAVSASLRWADLTVAEQRIARAVACGLTNRETAELYVLSERTVETHLSTIYRKVGVRSRTQLALRL